MSRILVSLLALTFLFPFTVNAQDFTDAQKAEIEKMFKEYLLENGDVVMESVGNYQERAAREQQEEAEKQAKQFMSNLNDRDDLPVAGNEKGDVVIVEFFDYNCGYCRRALEEIQKVIKKDDKVKVVLLDMPILGPSSMEAAKWSLAAEAQGKYWDYHLKIMNFNGEKSPKNLEKLAKDVGLDIDQLKKDKDSDEIADRLEKNVEQAQKIGIRGTPGFIIGDAVTPGFIPATEIQAMIKDQRENKS